MYFVLEQSKKGCSAKPPVPLEIQGDSVTSGTQRTPGDEEPHLDTTKNPNVYMVTDQHIRIIGGCCDEEDLYI